MRKREASALCTHGIMSKSLPHAGCPRPIPESSTVLLNSSVPSHQIAPLGNNTQGIPLPNTHARHARYDGGPKRR